MLSRKIPALVLGSILSGMLLVGCTSTTSDTSSETTTVDAKKVLQNENARIAISMAIDKSQITDVILNNGSTPVTNFVPETLALDETGKDYRSVAGEMGYKYSKEEAAKYWEDAKKELGFEEVNMEFLTTDSETSKKVGEFIQSQLQTNLEGLQVKIKQVPFKQKQELEGKGEFELLYSSWVADYPDPLTFLETFTQTGKFGKNSGYTSEQYNTLIEEAKKSTSLEDSWKKYAEAEKLLLDDCYLTPIYQSNTAEVERGVKDIVVSPYGARNLYKWASVEGKDTLNLISSADLPSLDVSKTTDSLSFDVINNVMEGLVRVDLEGKLAPGVATSWEASEDKMTWTFKLNKDAKWSNGEPVTAKDFEYSWKRTLDPATGSQYGFIMYDVVGAEDYNMGTTTDASTVGVKALDDYTLEVKLVRPVNYFDRLMGFPVFFPQNEKFVEATGEAYGTSNDAMVYNGPFTLTKWKMEDQYTMSKNESYWDKGAVKLQTINTKIVKDASTALNLYETGEVDSIGLSSENVETYKNKPEFKSTKNATTFFILMNAGE